MSGIECTWNTIIVHVLCECHLGPTTSAVEVIESVLSVGLSLMARLFAIKIHVQLKECGVSMLGQF